MQEKNKKVLSVLKKTSHINIGVNKEYTIKQFAIMIGKLFNKKINLKFNKSYPDGTPGNCWIVLLYIPWVGNQLYQLKKDLGKL